jgi:hypothetical protein
LKNSVIEKWFPEIAEEESSKQVSVLKGSSQASTKAMAEGELTDRNNCCNKKANSWSSTRRRKTKRNDQNSFIVA